MVTNDTKNRYESFTDQELNILSTALYVQLQYSKVGQALYQQIIEEIARRRIKGIINTNY